MNSCELPWLRPTLSDNHIPAAVHREFNSRRLVKPAQLAQLRSLFPSGELPKELVARLDSRHKLALTEEEADELILQRQEAGHGPTSTPPSPCLELAPSRAADFIPNPRLLATAEQRDTILTLLRQISMERRHRTKYRLNLLNYNQVRAEEIINELAEWLDYCQSGELAAA